MQNMNISDEKLQELLNLAGKRMGTDPMKLKAQLEQGAFNDVLKKAGMGQNAALQQALQNPKALEAMLNTPQAKKMLQDLMGGK